MKQKHTIKDYAPTRLLPEAPSMAKVALEPHTPEHLLPEADHDVLLKPTHVLPEVKETHFLPEVKEEHFLPEVKETEQMQEPGLLLPDRARRSRKTWQDRLAESY